MNTQNTQTQNEVLLTEEEVAKAKKEAILKIQKKIAEAKAKEEAILKIKQEREKQKQEKQQKQEQENKEKSNYIKFYKSLDGSNPMYYTVISYNGEKYKHESDKPMFERGVKKEKVGLHTIEVDYFTLSDPKIAKGFTGDKLKFYSAEMWKNLKNPKFQEKVISVIYDANQPYLNESIDPKSHINTLNFFNPERLTDNFNKNRNNKEFPLTKKLLQKMFKDDYNSILNFLSFRLKNSGVNPKIAFVLYGINKSGKSTFVNDFLPNLFGKSNVKGELNIKKTEDLTFNSKFISKMFTCFEEFNTVDDSLVNKFKNMITADSYDVNEKFMMEVEMPHYNTYIMNTNNYPQWLEDEDKSQRFIVLSINEKLYEEETKVEDLKLLLNEAPAFLNYLDNFNCKLPTYNDFDRVNDLGKFTKNEFNIWGDIIEKLKDNNNIEKKIKDKTLYIRITTETSKAVTQLYNDKLGNTDKNIIYFNNKKVVSNIMDIKKNTITAFYQKPLNLGNGVRWTDYIAIQESAVSEPSKQDIIEEDKVIQESVSSPSLKEDIITEDKVVKESPVVDAKESPVVDVNKVTISDVKNANKVMENKSKEEIINSFNLDYTIFKEQLAIFSQVVTNESLEIYKQNPKTFEMLSIIYKLARS